MEQTPVNLGYIVSCFETFSPMHTITPSQAIFHTQRQATFGYTTPPPNHAQQLFPFTQPNPGYTNMAHTIVNLGYTATCFWDIFTHEYNHTITKTIIHTQEQAIARYSAPPQQTIPNKYFSQTLNYHFSKSHP